MRNLKDANAFDPDKYPTRDQLGVKIRYCRTLLNKSFNFLCKMSFS